MPRVMTLEEALDALEAEKGKVKILEESFQDLVDDVEQRDTKIAALQSEVAEARRERDQWKARGPKTVVDALTEAWGQVASLEANLAAKTAALQPFSSGGGWGTWKAFMVHGPATKEDGIRASKQITAWQVEVDAALASSPDAALRPATRTEAAE